MYERFETFEEMEIQLDMLYECWRHIASDPKKFNIFTLNRFLILIQRFIKLMTKDEVNPLLAGEFMRILQKFQETQELLNLREAFLEKAKEALIEAREMLKEDRQLQRVV